MIDEKRLMELLQAEKSKNQVIDDYTHGIQTGLRRAIKLTHDQPKVGWIPVSERVPSTNSRKRWFLVQVKNGNKPMLILNYKKEYDMFGEIENDKYLGDHIKGEPFAWMPLPGKYKEREQK